MKISVASVNTNSVEPVHQLAAHAVEIEVQESDYIAWLEHQRRSQQWHEFFAKAMLLAQQDKAKEKKQE